MVVIPLEMSAFVPHKWQKWRILCQGHFCVGNWLSTKYLSTVALAGKVNYFVLFLLLATLVYSVWAGIKESDTGLAVPSQWDLVSDKQMMQEEQPLQVSNSYCPCVLYSCAVQRYFLQAKFVVGHVYSNIPFSCSKRLLWMIWYLVVLTLVE